MDNLLNPTKEMFGKALAQTLKYPTNVLVVMLGLVLIFTIGWDNMYRPLGQRICAEANAKMFAGNFNACEVAGRAAGIIGNAFRAMFGGGAGGPVATPPIEALASGPGHATTATTTVAPWEIESEVVLSTPMDVDIVVQAPVFVYVGQPLESEATTQRFQWNVLANPKVRIYQYLRTAVGTDWVRTTEMGHPSAMYMPARFVNVTGLPTLPPPPLREQDPWGDLSDNRGPLMEDGQFAVNAWKALRAQGLFLVDAHVETVLHALSTTGPEWRKLYDTIKNVRVSATDVTNILQQGDSAALRDMVVAGMQIKVTEIARGNLLFDNGKQQVTLQSVVELNGAAYKVGEPVQVQIRILRKAQLVVENDKLLATEGGK